MPCQYEVGRALPAAFSGKGGSSGQAFSILFPGCFRLGAAGSCFGRPSLLPAARGTKAHGFYQIQKSPFGGTLSPALGGLLCGGLYLPEHHGIPAGSFKEHQ